MIRYYLIQMQFLNTTIVFLQEENKELKDKIKMMEELDRIVSKERGEDQKELLNMLHLEQIKVIREMAEQREEGLQRQIKKLKAEIKELTSSSMSGEEERMNLKIQIQRKMSQNQYLKGQNEQLRQQIRTTTQKLSQIDRQYVFKQQQMETLFKQRQKQIMENYMQKIDQLAQNHEDALIDKERIIVSQNKKVELMQDEKNILEEELQNIIGTLNKEENKKIRKEKSHNDEVIHLKKENQDLLHKNIKLQTSIFDLQQKFKDEKRSKSSIQQELKKMKKRYGELESSKNKQIQKQKSRTSSVIKNLNQHQKYLKGQFESTKKKEKEYNNSKKILINKIRQMEGKSHHKSNNTSFVDKTVLKPSKKYAFDSCQSASLDNSMHKESPSVSCFLKEGKIQVKKKPLSINTDHHDTLLRFETIDTPNFESAKQINKKTVKLKK